MQCQRIAAALDLELLTVVENMQVCQKERPF